jgi:hypothetical protein
MATAEIERLSEEFPLKNSFWHLWMVENTHFSLPSSILHRSWCVLLQQLPHIRPSLLIRLPSRSVSNHLQWASVVYLLRPSSETCPSPGILAQKDREDTVVFLVAGRAPPPLTSFSVSIHQHSSTSHVFSLYHLAFGCKHPSTSISPQ